LIFEQKIKNLTILFYILFSYTKNSAVGFIELLKTSNLDKSQIEYIRTSFAKMKTKEDFLRLLNKVKPMIYGQKAIDFKLNQLTWHANPELGGKRYMEFEIKKKSGSSRKIHAPVNGLKALQSVISVILQCVYEPTKVVNGFVLGRSIYDNASWHVGSNYVYNVDLKDFFPSIDQARVWKTIQLKPFNLSSRLEIANIIASIACTSIEVERKDEFGNWQKVKRNVLPQGAPTSPVLTNIVCQKLDYLLTAVANRFGVRYSRYADDITFSSMHSVYQNESEFVKELKRIIESQNFQIKESKTRLQRQGYRMEVTGLLVNDKVNVQKRYVKQLRMWLYYWERYGYERANEYFTEHYLKDKGHVKSNLPSMASVIAGKLDFLKMIVGVENQLFQNLKLRFDNLSGNEKVETQLQNNGQSSVFSDHSDVNISKKNANDEIQDAISFPVYHNPRELVALLKNFSVNDSALKYTTHSWDAGRDANMFKDLSEFIDIAQLQYNEFSFELRGLSENLNGKIYNFLFNKEISESGWGDINPKKRIYFGWSSPELFEACENDVSLNPEDFILPQKYQIQKHGKTLQKFKHIIDVFKNEIEVRDENAALENLIIQKHDNYLISFSAPKILNLQNKSFYTDIQWFGKALDLIFEGIKKYPEHPEVEYSIAENNAEKLVLTILHLNSYKRGLSIKDDKLNINRGDFGTIKDKLRNLCDWSIESLFEEGAFRINYLVSEKNIPAFENVESAQGFKHILTFYK
jgi:RNA-directed DNA polymerase